MANKQKTKIQDENEDNKMFWKILNCKIGEVKDDSDVSDIEFEVDFKSSKISLFKFARASFKFWFSWLFIYCIYLRVSDSNSEAVKIQHIADGPLSKSLLDSNVII